jgi:alkylation response protein AidB-like acyl-CoA dehydrogenase
MNIYRQKSSERIVMAASTFRQGEAPDSAAAVTSDRLDALVCELTAEEKRLVSAASSLVPVLSANAETADATRRLPEEDIKALREAGLFRLATPRAYGGHEAGARGYGHRCGTGARLLVGVLGAGGVLQRERCPLALP